MLRLAACCSVLFVWGVQGDVFNDLNLFHNPEPHLQAFEWERPHFDRRSSEALEKDREPLGPDYKDPNPAATEDKPVQGSTESPDKPVLNPKKEHQGPKHPINPLLPDGVVDINANGGFPLFASPFGPEFSFPPFPTGLDKPDTGFGFGGLFEIDEGPKWWKGENVCVEREESADSDDPEKKNETEKREPNFFQTAIRLSNCYETENKYECTTKINNHGVVKTFTVRYKCCYGYKRTPISNCTKKVELKQILPTLEDLKLNQYRQMITQQNLDSKFENGNYTIFVPAEDAISDYNDKSNDMNKVDLARRRRALIPVSPPDFVLGRATEGFKELADLENEQLLKSEDQKTSIRINIYPTHTMEKMLTANCARVTNANVLSTNGIVHVVDKVINPSSDNIEELIKKHPKLTQFRQVLDHTDIPKHFKPDGHYTIFAATDEAFNKLDGSLKQKLLNGGSCASNILKHHIVAHTICSAAIIGNATTHNVGGEILNMERTSEDELIFEGKAKIIDTDNVGSNGVLHLIDTLIIPESGQYIGAVLKSNNFSSFQELVEKAGLTEELNNYENATVFVPANAAFENPKTQKILEEIGDDKAKLSELVRYHILDRQIQSCDMTNNLKAETKDQGKEIRINLYSTAPFFTSINRATINCARVIGFDEKTCGSVVHEVNKVLVPPTQNIYDLIQSDDKYSTLRKLLNGTEVEKILQENNRSITFLAFTDETFATLDTADAESLLNDKNKAEEVLRGHVLTEVLCCSGVGPFTFGLNSFIPTLGDMRVEVGRTGSLIRVNRAVVTSCDNVATNGVLHNINKILAPRKPPTATLGGGFFLFDF